MTGALRMNAQTVPPERCGFERSSDAEVFERWLVTKQTASTRKNSSTYKVPVVVHILHVGEALGTGYNFSDERVKSQIKTLNEDFRRKPGTPGFNTHPNGGDAQIEFVLAQKDPDGNSTNGIVRINMTTINPGQSKGDIITLCSQYSYWDPERYLNIWSLPTGLPPGLLLGSGRFPIADLEGLPNENPEGDGVFINARNFGKGDTLTDPNYDGGRTLTHELGHFFGLLHTWGSLNNSRQCDSYTDYCNDTPPLPIATNGCPDPKPKACSGEDAMIENYMDGSYDQCMNIFTNDQIARMHTVINNSPRRKSLLTSPVIDRADDVTGVENEVVNSVQLYPNPADEKIFLTTSSSYSGKLIGITARTLSGQILFERTILITGEFTEIPLSGLREKIIVLTIQIGHAATTRLIALK